MTLTLIMDPTFLLNLKNCTWALCLENIDGFGQVFIKLQFFKDLPLFQLCWCWNGGKWRFCVYRRSAANDFDESCHDKCLNSSFDKGQNKLKVNYNVKILTMNLWKHAIRNNANDDLDIISQMLCSISMKFDRMIVWS